MEQLTGIEILKQSAGAIPADVLMFRHGIWYGPDIDTLSVEERMAYIDNPLASRPVTLSHELHDPDGAQISTFYSNSILDLKNGVFEDTIISWNNQGEIKEAHNDQVVMASRYVLAPEEEWHDGVPSFYPSEIVVNGITIHEAQSADIYPEERATVNRSIEFSQMLKEGMANKKSVEYFADLIFGDGTSGHFAKAAFGEEPFLKGVNARGWSPIQRLLNKYFSRLSPKSSEPQKLTFTFDPVDGARFVDRLKDAHGLNSNSLEPRRDMRKGRTKAAASFEEGAAYVTRAEHFLDEQSGREVIRAIVAPQDIPEGFSAVEAYELIRLEYSETKPGVFQLELAQMNGESPKNFAAPEDARKLIGVMAEACNYLARNEFPPYRDIIFRHNLFDKWSEVPPPEEEYESLWTSLFGCELERPIVDKFGTSVGSTQYFMNRYKNQDGTLDEVDVCFDVAYQSGDHTTEHDGAQPDILHRKKALERGFIAIGHGHYDHNTIEDFAKQIGKDGAGWLRGIDVVLKEYDYRLIRSKLKEMKVAEKDWPNFICYDTKEAQNRYPDRITQVDDNYFVYKHIDENGVIRSFNQIVRNGAYHTALSDVWAHTPCFIPLDPADTRRKIHNTILLASDYATMNEHVKPILARGQLLLAEHFPELVSEDELLAIVPDKDHLYMMLSEATSSDKSGYSTKDEEFKDTLRIMLRALPDGKIPVFYGFSTNHLEYQAVMDVLNEPEFLRHIVGVNASAEKRLTFMNNTIVDPDLDLSKVVVPPEKLPQSAYDVAIEAIEKYVDGLHDDAEKKASHAKSQKSLDQRLAEDVRYQVFKNILDNARTELDSGNDKPLIIFDTFFKGDKNAIDKLIIQLGFDARPDGKPRAIPNIVRNAIGDKRKSLRGSAKNTLKITEEFEQDKNFTDSDPEYWMLRCLEKYGRIKFDPTRDLINQQNMYKGIMRMQDEISVRRTRGSKSGKSLRDEPDKLAIFSTGPIGSMQEYFAGLSCLVRGDGLFDASSISRSTGYQVDADNIVPFVLQPASMGSAAQMSKDAMFAFGANSRGLMIFDVMSSGFRIHNPGKYRMEMGAKFADQGCTFDKYQKTNELIINNKNGHIEGHGHYQDKYDIYGSDYLKAFLIENIHIANDRTLEAERELIARTGNKTSVTQPCDWTGRKIAFDADGEAYLKDVVHLTPRLWTVDKVSKFGVMHSWQVNMKLHLGLSKRGLNRSDAMSIRDVKGDFAQNTAQIAPEGYLRPYDGSKYMDDNKGPRYRRMAPSFAEIQQTGGKPVVPMQGYLNAQAMKHEKTICEVLPPELML